MGTLEQLNSNSSTPFSNRTSIGVGKDTVALPPFGFVRIRFRACNPGYWFFHCHYEYHMFSGMTATIKVGTDNDMPKAPFGFPRCGNYLQPVLQSQPIITNTTSMNITFMAQYASIFKQYANSTW